MVKQPSARSTLGACLVLGVLLWPATVPAQTGPDRQLLLELLERVEQLEQEVRELRGELEVSRHRQSGAGPRSAQGSAAEEPPQRPAPAPAAPYGAAPGYDTAPRSGYEAAPAGAPSKYDFRQEPPPVAPPAPGGPMTSVTPGMASRPAAPSATEQGSYDVAYGSLRNGQYEQAAAGFQRFLSSHPDSPLAANAQYWLGEAYYVSRDYENARQAFIDLGVRYPNSDKLPDAMLKLGYVYDSLGDPAKAREVLQKLVEAYPTSRSAVLARQRLQTLR